MARADLAIGAGGSTTWERLSSGSQALVSIAANQHPCAHALHEHGFHLLGKLIA